MAHEDDIRRIIEQERGLVFTQFDEDTGFALGSHIRERGKALGKSIATAVYLWDRMVFFGATAGATAANAYWMERKRNTARLVHKSSYRVVLEHGGDPTSFAPRWGLDPAQYTIAGGAFPISIRGAGMIGVAVVSGLDERSDHNLSVEGVCAALGVDAEDWALPDP